MGSRSYRVRGVGASGEEAVSITVSPEGFCRAVVGERVLEFERIALPDGGFSLRFPDGRLLWVRVSGTAPNFRVNVGGLSRDLEAVSERDTWLRTVGAGTSGGSGELKVAMPGRVVKVLAADGDHVSQGQGVLIVEAMKMENEVKAPFNGVVCDLRVVVGDSVEAQQPLARIQPVEDAA